MAAFTSGSHQGFNEGELIPAALTDAGRALRPAMLIFVYDSERVGTRMLVRRAAEGMQRAAFFQLRLA